MTTPRPQPPTRPTPQAQPPQRPSAGSCDVCSGPTYELHCKIICRNCGYMRDCSDL